MDIGHAGGQKFDVAVAIRTFLQQMAEGNIDFGAAVIKELLQNADDAKATELEIILDERTIPKTDVPDYHPLLAPGLLVRNNRPFSEEDFRAICEIGKGHKFANPTAAGRFGIGFNSVYFLTDTPLIFSQRQVHLFDLLHAVVPRDVGWVFPLDEFPQGGEGGAIKAILEWTFPKVALASGESFADLAHSGEDYAHSIFRLPLRRWDGKKDPPLFQNSFRTNDVRLELLEAMFEQGSRSLLFLKHMLRLNFGVLRDQGLEAYGQIEVSPHPEIFWTFLARVTGASEAPDYQTESFSCDPFERIVSIHTPAGTTEIRKFFVQHFAPFGNAEILECRRRLTNNKERAIPWTAIGIPKDIETVRFVSQTPPWHVFLPLLESGPCSCELHGAMFVGPSRQRLEYRSDESDEAQRKTEWNQLLVKYGLVGLLRDADFDRLVPDLFTEYPKEALGLIPRVPLPGAPHDLGEYLKKTFHAGPWILRMKDVWNNPFQLLVNDPTTITQLDLIPDWLSAYRDCFEELASANRKFVAFKIGEAVRERLSRDQGIDVHRDLQKDVIRSVLGADTAPQAKHLADLVVRLLDRSSPDAALDGLWAFQEVGEGQVLRFSAKCLYLVSDPEGEHGIHAAIRGLGLRFENVFWVESTVGLPSLRPPWPQNVKHADAPAAFELLARVDPAIQHDRFVSAHHITGIVDFLCTQDPNWLRRDLRLAFLVKTASGQLALRRNGAIFLPSDTPSDDEQALWRGLLQGAFPEVEPEFAMQLRRLLKHAPALQECLHAADCRVELVQSTPVFELLHRSRMTDPGLVGRMSDRQRQFHRDATRKRLAQRAASALIREADRLWEEWDESRRLTFVLLPIHRRADGSLVSLTNADLFDATAIAEHFWLQSDEDLHDAPVQLENRPVLHSEDAAINRFYRNRFGIQPKDRTSVLRECLNVIGSTDANNPMLLKYIASTFDTIVESLERAGTPADLADAHHLRESLRTSRSVPCIDKVWRRPPECKSGISIAKRLKQQGWPDSRLADLVGKLVNSEAIVTMDRALARVVDQLHNIDEIEASQLAQMAATSECAIFGLRDRAKLISDNLVASVCPEQRAQAVDVLPCKALGGDMELANLTRLPRVPAYSNPRVWSDSASNAGDLKALSKDWGLPEGTVDGVLAYLHVPVLTISEVVRAVVREATAVRMPDMQSTWESLTDWLGKIAEHDSPSIVEGLGGAAWVLARKSDKFEFREPQEVLYRPEAGQILDKQFWVIATNLTAPLANLRSKLLFRELDSSPENVEQLALCLANSPTASRSAFIEVYRLILRLVRTDQNAVDTWYAAASRNSVYRLFRNPDIFVSGQRLYLGTADLKNDFGDQLRCLLQNDIVGREIADLYRELGVVDCPTHEQITAAIARIHGADDAQRVVHHALVELLENQLRSDLERTIDLSEASALTVRTFTGEYVAISDCYRYPLVTAAEQIDPASRPLIADERDPGTRRLLKILDEHRPGASVFVRDVATATVTEIQEATPSPRSAMVIAPWEEWLQDVEDSDSEVRTAIASYLSGKDIGPVRLKVVSHLSIEFELPDGRTVRHTRRFKGPTAFGDGTGRICLLKDWLDRDFERDPAKLEELDRTIACEVGRLLNPACNQQIADLAIESLERPPVVLKKLRKRAEEFLLHQYNDQNADAEFAARFDDYLRTATSAAKKRQLEGELLTRVYEKFVPARREQIRAYGYDEFSVFSEMLQNAEDAYQQSVAIGRRWEDAAYIRFRVLEQPLGCSLLRVEHAGRPFNYYRHGMISDSTFKKDVEGVLRSAGSYKPQTQLEHDANTATIGKFGLGFKSVLLLTDNPRIHSGQWHFEIEAGCLPRPLPRPDDLANDVTRFELPLNTPLCHDDLVDRVVGLMPFLRQITKLEFAVGSDIVGICSVGTTAMESPDPRVRMERVKITVSDGDPIEVLRARHADHQGQIAIHLDSEGLPAPWTQAFEFDLFVGLPLRLHLGVGISVSHNLKVQAGRTHLIALDENRALFSELAAMLACIPPALEKCVSHEYQPSEVMQRFWTLWNWDAGDREALPLRQILADQLFQLAVTRQVVPTRDSTACIALESGPVFCFHGIPEAFVDELIREAVDIRCDDHAVELHAENVLRHATHSALLRLSNAANRDLSAKIVVVGWTELSSVFEGRAWFAERPELLSTMARTTSADDQTKSFSWLGRCKFRDHHGEPRYLHELLPADFPGIDDLPRACMHLLDECYGEEAVTLLLSAGMPRVPTADTVESWIGRNLTAQECAGLLKYLSTDDRWIQYHGLREVLLRPWFPDGAIRVTTAEAIERGLVHLEFDGVFLSWVGVSQVPPPSPPARANPPLNAHAVLTEISRWWQQHSIEYVREYERRTYPTATPPDLRAGITELERNPETRRNWLTLFILGCLHTLGRTRPGQHREFLRKCRDRGWFDVFTQWQAPAERWIGILDDYLDEIEGEEYRLWLLQFVSIYALSRHLPAYATAFLDLDRYPHFVPLETVTRPRANPNYQGGGPDAPPITRALGIGACFVVRELVRTGVLRNVYTHPHCYVPHERVRNLFARIGWDETDGIPASRTIYEFVAGHIGIEDATFGNCFDLPFQIIAEDEDLLGRFFQLRAAASGE